LIGWLVKGTATVSAMPVNESLEVTERWQGSRRLVFILNHSDQTQVIQLDETCTNLLDGKTLSGKVPIGPKDVLIISSDK
jgi:beta-galactosidase GanA